MIFDVQTSGGLPDFEVFVKQFPRLQARILGYVGKQAARELCRSHLSGQHGVTVPLEKNGRRLVKYSIGKDARYSRVSSFPLNFWSRGNKLKSGHDAKSIIQGKLKQSLRLQAYVNQASTLIIDDWFNEGKKGSMKSL